MVTFQQATGELNFSLASPLDSHSFGSDLAGEPLGLPES